MFALGPIQRHLSELGQALKDIPDYRFTGSKKVVDGVLMQRERDGVKKQVRHDAPIADDDWKKLGE